ncbi:phospholipase D/nuclease [Trichoderma gracile]
MPPPRAPFQFGALDRRAMEQERLERLAKRKGSSDANKEDDIDSDGDVVEIPPPKRQATASTLAAKSTESKPTASIQRPASASLAVPQSSLPYPNGTVKRTWARGCARTGDDITVEEVFQKDHLELALLSSFQWDEEWMLSKLDISRTKLLLLAFAKDEAQKNQMRGNVPANIKFCFPPMHGVGAMHSKLQLLKYPNRLRVVIPTGNLVPYDWGETGVMENMVFLIDLPRLENPATIPQSSTAFYTELVYFLQATGVGDKLVASLANYDFSKTSDIAFVHTIPGSHTGKAAERTGYCGLGASVAALGLASSGPVEVDLLARCCDLHSLNHEFIEAIYSACRGRDGIEDFKNKSGAASSRSKAAKKPDEAASKELQDRFRIYFPTERTVTGSRGGRNAGGTICVQAKWWRSPTFPIELVRDVIARDRLLVHSKMIFVRRVGHDQTTQQRPGWAYVGSANLSESAWGRLSRDRSTKAIKMNCRNWECGVILPVPESKAVDKARASGDMAMFAGTVPVPMQVPGPAYASSDRPWFYAGA